MVQRVNLYSFSHSLHITSTNVLTLSSVLLASASLSRFSNCSGRFTFALINPHE